MAMSEDRFASIVRDVFAGTSYSEFAVSGFRVELMKQARRMKYLVALEYDPVVRQWSFYDPHRGGTLIWLCREIQARMEPGE
jgi:hypothetical protein